MTLVGFLKKEIIQMLRDPIMVFALLLMPVVQVCMFNYAITNEPKNLRVAVAAEPNDYLVNRLYEHTLASGWFNQVPQSTRSPYELIASGTADVVYVAPPQGLTRAFYDGRPTSLQVLINASNVLKAQAVSSYTRAILANFLMQELHLDLTSQLNFAARILFNPEMETSIFLVPAIMSMVVGMSILSLICVSITKEKECGTLETLISAPISKIQLMLGKTLPFILVAFFNLLTIMLVGFWQFHVPFRGSWLMLLIAFGSFSFAMSALGILISTVCENQQQALLAIMITLFLMMMLSGTLCPIENMPFVLRVLSNINPLTHFVYLMRNILLKGSTYYYLWQQLWPILTFGLVIGFVGVKEFKQTL